MKKNLPIKMKTTSKLSNPAKNEILEGDSILSDYIKEISDYKSLTPAEEKEIAKKAKEGDVEAKQKLIKANLKLVVTIAKKAIHMSNLPMIDLIQEGNLGLMAAAEKLASAIASAAPIAVRNSKKAINDGLQVDMDKAIAIEEKLFGDCFETEDQKEGMKAFLEKRKVEKFVNK